MPRNSQYSGELNSGGTFTITALAQVPTGETVRDAILFFFHTWSHAENRRIELERQTEIGNAPPSSLRSCSDWERMLLNDCPSGTRASISRKNTRQ